jgi:hypothetical protein
MRVWCVLQVLHPDGSLDPLPISNVPSWPLDVNLAEKNQYRIGEIKTRGLSIDSVCGNEKVAGGAISVN